MSTIRYSYVLAAALFLPACFAQPEPSPLPAVRGVTRGPGGQPLAGVQVVIHGIDDGIDRFDRRSAVRETTARKCRVTSTDHARCASRRHRNGGWGRSEPGLGVAFRACVPMPALREDAGMGRRPVFEDGGGGDFVATIHVDVRRLIQRRIVRRVLAIVSSRATNVSRRPTRR